MFGGLDRDEQGRSRYALAWISRVVAGSRHVPGNRRCAENPLPRYPRAAQRRHLLRDIESAGGGQGDRARMRPDAGDRLSQQQQFVAAC